MVSIVFYNNTSKDLVVNKSLTAVLSTTGDFRATVDALRPTVMVQGTVPANANYAYIADFGRYYYISDREYVTKDLCNLSLYTDVRKSFASQLANAKGVVARNNATYNMYLPDNKIPVGARKAVAIRKFGNTPFSSARSVSMTVFGGTPYVMPL